MSNHYLGFDLSTQQLKAFIINDDLETLHEAYVHFDKELPEYKTDGGVNRHSDGLTVTTPTIMFVKAVDMVMKKLQDDGVNFSRIMAMTGATQQVTSAYWKRGTQKILRSLDPSKSLFEQLDGCFSIPDGPSWMCENALQQCKNLENAVGGAEKVTELTGSKTRENFTACQIARIYQEKPQAYENTERIALVSSVVCSLFLGDYASTDFSDASPTNLLDIHNKCWADVCLNACAPGLHERLGVLCPGTTVLGTVNSYFQQRYGFRGDCKLLAFTGDNPSTLAGLRLKLGDIGVSLGTADCISIWMNDPKPHLDGMIFVNVLDSSAYHLLLAYKNGSLTRERVRNNTAESSWEKFDELLESEPRGNSGKIGMFFDDYDMTPRIIGHHRFNEHNERLDAFSNSEKVRALIEGQFLAKRVHLENLGYKIDSSTRVIATGGASRNKAILQVISDIFNSPVYAQDIPNSAGLGSCYRAKHAHVGGDYHKVIQGGHELHLAASPNEDADKIYTPMTARYRMLEKEIIESQKETDAGN